MDALELTRWAAFEQEYGPLLVHDRIDFGFARLLHMLANIYKAPRAPQPKFRKFLPPWVSKQAEQSPTELEAVLKGMVSGADG